MCKSQVPSLNVHRSQRYGSQKRCAASTSWYLPQTHYIPSCLLFLRVGRGKQHLQGGKGARSRISSQNQHSPSLEPSYNSPSRLNTILKLPRLQLAAVFSDLRTDSKQLQQQQQLLQPWAAISSPRCVCGCLGPVAKTAPTPCTHCGSGAMWRLSGC